MLMGWREREKWFLKRFKRVGQERQLGALTFLFICFFACFVHFNSFLLPLISIFEARFVVGCILAGVTFHSKFEK